MVRGTHPRLLLGICLGIASVLAARDKEDTQVARAAAAGYQCLSDAVLANATRSGVGLVGSTLSALAMNDSYQREFIRLSPVQGGFQPDIVSVGNLAIATQLGCIERANPSADIALVQDLLASSTAGGRGGDTQSERERQAVSRSSYEAPTGPLVSRSLLKALGPLFNMSCAASAEIDNLNGTQPSVRRAPWLTATRVPGQSNRVISSCYIFPID